MSNLKRCYSKHVLVFIPSYKYLKHCLEIGDETQDKINSLIRVKKAPTITIQHTPIIPSPGIPPPPYPSKVTIVLVICLIMGKNPLTWILARMKKARSEWLRCCALDTVTWVRTAGPPLEFVGLSRSSKVTLPFMGWEHSTSSVKGAAIMGLMKAPSP